MKKQKSPEMKAAHYLLMHMVAASLLGMFLEDVIGTRGIASTVFMIYPFVLHLVLKIKGK